MKLPRLADGRRVFALCATMMVVVIAVCGGTLGVLYRNAVDRERDRLVEVLADHITVLTLLAADSTRQAPGMGDAADADRLERLRGVLRSTGALGPGQELIVIGLTGSAAGEAIRLGRGTAPPPETPALVAWPPIRSLLAGEEGTFAGPDTGGEDVLAAYMPAADLGLGIVLKTDLHEIRAPFLRAGGIAVIVALVATALGSFAYVAFGAPMIARLRAGQARFRELFDNMKGGAVVYEAIDDGRDFVIRDLNRGAERIDHIDRDGVIGRRLTEAFPGVERFGLLDVLRRVFRTGRPEHFPMRFYSDDERSGWRDNYVYKLESGEVVALYDDVTKQKQAEQELREGEERWRSITTLQANATLIVDADNRILYVNKAAEALFGKSHRDLLGHPFGFPVAVGDVAEIEIVRPGGSVAYAEMEVIPMQAGGQQQFLLFIRDVSAHRRTEGDLRKLFQAIEQSPASVVITDVQGRIEYVNPKFTQTTGYTYAEVVGKNPRILKSGHTSGGEYTSLWKTIGSGNVWRGEFHNRRKNGELFWELAAIAPVRDVRGRVTHYVAVKEDITDRKATEERLRQAAKMQAIGELTGGIAHDFNNVLAIILGNLQLLEEDLPKDDERHELIADAIWSAERGAELTSRLLAFARRQHLNPRVTDVNHVIRRMTSVLRRTLGEGIEIREVLAPDLWQSMIDRGQLETALLNLVVNARDAMPDGGVLTITTENTEAEPQPPGGGAAQAGDAVLIAVGDTGSGMAPGIVERIFEPFFTTKSFGKGSGLGLSMVYGFVNQSGGHITVESALGHGTTIRLYLPRALEGEVVEPQPAAIESAVSKRRRVVLVVEDDGRVRSTAVRVLQREGYEVHEAGSADEALDRLTALGKLDLLFTDIVLPDGMNGPALARKVLEQRPETLVLFTSGYASDNVPGGAQPEMGEPFLRKPYRRGELVAKVEEVLAAAE